MHPSMSSIKRNDSLFIVLVIWFNAKTPIFDQRLMGKIKKMLRGGSL